MAALVDDGALHPAHAARALDLVLARYNPAALAALVAEDLAGKHVRVVLGASVATAPLRAVALPWLRGASSLALKPSRHQPAFAALLRQHFDVPWRAHDDHADHVVAHGRDETLATIRAALPAATTFEGRGHGFALSVVRTADLADAASAVAADVAWYDQRGCLSPRAVLVDGDAARFAELLADALAVRARELPPGPMDAGLAAAVMQWQGVKAATAEGFWRVDGGCVALTDGLVLDTPGARNVTVCAVPAGGLAAAMGAEAPWVTALGVAGETDGIDAIAGFAGRVCAAGTLQDPPLDGPEDVRAQGKMSRSR